MSKIPLVQDEPEDALFEEEARTALHKGFQQLETPSTEFKIESLVKRELTSGTDLRPLHHQIGLRVVWTVVPALTAFVVVAAFLRVRPVPRVPLTHWILSHDESGAIVIPRIVPDRLAISPAPLPPLVASANGYATDISGTDAPAWFHKPEDKKPVPTVRFLSNVNLGIGKAVQK